MKKLIKKISGKSKNRQRTAHNLPTKYRNVNDLQWSDQLEREIYRLRARF